jgi:hypothetical protein
MKQWRNYDKPQAGTTMARTLTFPLFPEWLMAPEAPVL